MAARKVLSRLKPSDSVTLNISRKKEGREGGGTENSLAKAHGILSSVRLPPYIVEHRDE